MKSLELEPIKDDPGYWDEMEAKIIMLLREEIYLPLMRELGIKSKVLKNANGVLLDAIKLGKITYHRGEFSGRFNASISKELKGLGARWDRKQGTWKIPQSSLPMDLRNQISASIEHFNQTLISIDKKLAGLIPEAIADKLKVENLFDKTIFKVEKNFKKSVKQLMVAPDLPASRRKVLASEWTNNMKLYVKEWTEKAIKDLRKDVQSHTFSGARYETMVKTIQKSYGESHNKAKFLARQETNLLLAKYKEDRYKDIGIKKYKWVCVRNAKDKSPDQHTPGNVRYYHGLNDQKIFSWDTGAIVNEKGERKNPGQDYNCRCYARPIVIF